MFLGEPFAWFLGLILGKKMKKWERDEGEVEGIFGGPERLLASEGVSSFLEKILVSEVGGVYC